MAAHAPSEGRSVVERKSDRTHKYGSREYGSREGPSHTSTSFELPSFHSSLAWLHVTLNFAVWKNGSMEEVKDGRMEEVKDGRMEVALKNGIAICITLSPCVRVLPRLVSTLVPEGPAAHVFANGSQYGRK